MKVKASAPGKVILFGEHSVVYRGPAIVLAIDKKVTALAEARKDDELRIEAPPIRVSGVFKGAVYRPIIGGPEGANQLKPIVSVIRSLQERSGRKTGVDLSITSELPIAVGLGSSAATAVATVAAVNEICEAGLAFDEISHLAFEAEKIVHGTPSGIDNTISCYGGGLVYDRERGIERLDTLEDFPLIIGNTGRCRSTGKLVSRVREMRKKNTVLDSVIEAISKVAQLGKDALLERDYQRVGQLMNINHGLLWALGVSSRQLDQLVNAALGAGALGAKLTGAGGGGCMIALPRPTGIDIVSKALERESGNPFIARISKSGVSVSKED